MKRVLIGMLLLVLSGIGYAQSFQTDTLQNGKLMVSKDPRIEMLGQKMAAYNEGLANKIQMVDGYRLMLLNTTDRIMAMQVRSTLLQQYPEQKIYMTFLSPYIKIKFGNFIEKAAAEDMKKKLLESKLITGNIYILPEKVESKPEKAVPTEE
jgi:hypothetical protein